MVPRTVLVVEDEILIRAILVETLVDEGYLVLEAENVLEAIAVLGRGQPIDALVTDVDMPGGLSGLDLAELVAVRLPGAAVVVTSGRPLSRRLSPSAMFLSKPYRLDDVLVALSRHFAAPGFSVCA